MTQIAAADTIQADFHNVSLTNDGVRFRLSQKGNEFWVRMERMVPAAAKEVSPETLDVRIGLVTGSHHMQVFWVPGDEVNTQIGFPFTWMIPEKRWVPRNSTFVRPPDVVHRSEVWNVVCSRCHTTGIEPRVDRVTHTVDTRAAELGISWEACHGPGQRHADARLAERGKPTAPDARTLRSEIVHPKKIDTVRASQICGFCHSMKWIDKSEPWLQHGFRYRPGDDLEQTTPIIKNQLRPFVGEVRPTVDALRPALRDLAKVTPDLATSFGVLNKFFNALTYKSSGGESLLFYALWLNHIGASVYSTQDANGPIRRGVILTDCVAAGALENVAKLDAQLGTLIALTNFPSSAQICGK